MRSSHLAFFAAIVAPSILAATVVAAAEHDKTLASPVYEVTVPDGYRSWGLIAPDEEAEQLDELRAVLGNDAAVEAYRAGTIPFPDGAILVKLAWKRVPSPEFAPASVPGPATTVQVMVKDGRRYPDSGGWGFGRFVDGKPVDREQHKTCFACHEANVIDHDYVFTRFAP